MSHSEKDRCLALAGLFQSAALVHSIARRRPLSHDALESSLASLLFIDADSVAEIYGGATGTRMGLVSLRDTLNNIKSIQTNEATRYIVSLLHLSRRLEKYPKVGATLAAGLVEIQPLANNLGISHDTTVHRLAELYRNTISVMGPRIIVKGEPEVLADDNQAARIRALLLAGIRSGVLWYQCGGNRLQLLFSRKALLEQVNDILART